MDASGDAVDQKEEKEQNTRDVCAELLPERELLDFCLWSFSLSFFTLGMIFSFMLLLPLFPLLLTDSWKHEHTPRRTRKSTSGYIVYLELPPVRAEVPPPLPDLTSSEHCMSGQIQWMSSSLWSSALRLLRVSLSSSSSGESDCRGARGPVKHADR